MECSSCQHPSEYHDLDGCRHMLPDGTYPCACEQQLDHAAAHEFLASIGY